MWLAHALTLSRLPIAVALVWAYGRPTWAAVLVVIAALTDALDGTAARRARRRGSTGPEIGGWLDPLVDKIFVVIVLATIAWHTRDFVLVALIATREIVLAPLFAVYALRKIEASTLKARPIGKAATIAQFASCGVAVIAPAEAELVAVAAAVLGLSAVLDHVAERVSPSAA